MKNLEANTRLVHDVAMRTTDTVLAVFVLPAEEYADVHTLVYERVKAGLEMYLMLRHRELQRLYGKTKEDATT